jgi:tetratricopeptide (TPR) repeat protein
MKNYKNKQIGVILIGLIILMAIVMVSVPGIRNRLLWRWEIARAYMGGVVNPVEAVPTAKSVINTEEVVNRPTYTVTPTVTIKSTLTAEPTATPQPSPTPLPEQVRLNSPAYELQDINNCGPATLAMYLRYYGWEGDQFTISDIIKPIPQDRNVNIEELDYYVKNYAGWLNTIYRVGGDLELLKQLTAAGFPVLIEETFRFDENYWPNDDRWAGHYLLVNGYDDQKQAFLTQDSYKGADLWVPYEELDRNWQAFNRVYTLVYLPEQEEQLKAILGENWDADANRQHALEVAEMETENDPENTFVWFNLGSNLVYFEQYDDAGLAYDKARKIGWPQRMLRYQFGPFLAYFHDLRNEDLMSLVEYALERTPNSEEALLWQGWGLYRAGDRQAAIESFQKAIEAHPDYGDAIYGLNYVLEN